MKASEIETMLEEGANSIGINLAQSCTHKFMEFMSILKNWNKKMNLTAIEEDRDIVIKHFLDSLTIIDCIPPYTESIMDIGSGAGFPGIPLGIVKDNINITLIDSLMKRITFLEEVKSKITLNKIDLIHTRAEDLARNEAYREQFDIVTARAVAPLNVLLEYCLPFVKVEGLFIAMKGSSTQEIDLCRNALDKLGGDIKKTIKLTLPFSDIKRNIIIIKKSRHTPTIYPRKPGKPSKNPL